MGASSRNLGPAYLTIPEQSKPLFDEDTVVPLVELPPPPDGGWGWVICFSSFVLGC